MTRWHENGTECMMPEDCVEDMEEIETPEWDGTPGGFGDPWNMDH